MHRSYYRLLSVRAVLKRSQGSLSMYIGEKDGDAPRNHFECLRRHLP